MDDIKVFLFLVLTGFMFANSAIAKPMQLAWGFGYLQVPSPPPDRYVCYQYKSQSGTSYSYHGCKKSSTYCASNGNHYFGAYDDSDAQTAGLKSCNN